MHYINFKSNKTFCQGGKVKIEKSIINRARSRSFYCSVEKRNKKASRIEEALSLVMVPQLYSIRKVVVKGFPHPKKEGVVIPHELELTTIKHNSLTELCSFSNRKRSILIGKEGGFIRVKPRYKYSDEIISAEFSPRSEGLNSLANDGYLAILANGEVKISTIDLLGGEHYFLVGGKRMSPEELDSRRGCSVYRVLEGSKSMQRQNQLLMLRMSHNAWDATMKIASFAAEYDGKEVTMAEAVKLESRLGQGLSGFVKAGKIKSLAIYCGKMDSIDGEAKVLASSVCSAINELLKSKNTLLRVTEDECLGRNFQMRPLGAAVKCSATAVSANVMEKFMAQYGVIRVKDNTRLSTLIKRYEGKIVILGDGVPDLLVDLNTLKATGISFDRKEGAKFYFLEGRNKAKSKANLSTQMANKLGGFSGADSLIKAIAQENINKVYDSVYESTSYDVGGGEYITDALIKSGRGNFIFAHKKLLGMFLDLRGEQTRNAILDFKFGINGRYDVIVADPTTELTGKEHILKFGEIYNPNIAPGRRVVCFRFPSVGEFEFYPARNVSREELLRRVDNLIAPTKNVKEMYKNIILNIKGGTCMVPAIGAVLQLLGGADFDIDKIAIVEQKELVDALWSIRSVVCKITDEDKKDTTPVTFNRETVLKILFSKIGRAGMSIGVITKLSELVIALRGVDDGLAWEVIDSMLDKVEELPIYMLSESDLGKVSNGDFSPLGIEICSVRDNGLYLFSEVDAIRSHNTLRAIKSRLLSLEESITLLGSVIFRRYQERTIDGKEVNIEVSNVLNKYKLLRNLSEMEIKSGHCYDQDAVVINDWLGLLKRELLQFKADKRSSIKDFARGIEFTPEQSQKLNKVEKDYPTKWNSLKNNLFGARNLFRMICSDDSREFRTKKGFVKALNRYVNASFIASKCGDLDHFERGVALMNVGLIGEGGKFDYKDGGSKVFMHTNKLEYLCGCLALSGNGKTAHFKEEIITDGGLVDGETITFNKGISKHAIKKGLNGVYKIRKEGSKFYAVKHIATALKELYVASESATYKDLLMQLDVGYSEKILEAIKRAISKDIVFTLHVSKNINKLVYAYDKGEFSLSIGKFSIDPLTIAGAIKSGDKFVISDVVVANDKKDDKLVPTSFVILVEKVD